MDATTQAKRGEKVRPSEVCEGDYVIMTISAYNYEKTGEQLCGRVIDAPDEWSRTRIAEKGAMSVMCDYAIESDDGTIWRWYTDNGYVIGPVDRPIGRSDIGRFAGFYSVE